MASGVPDPRRRPLELWLVACGWIGQAAFAWRTLLQWIVSERRRETVIPRTYWSWSIVGAVLTLVYALGRADPVFVLGALATGLIFVRNAWLEARRPDAAPARPALWPLPLGTALFVAMAWFDAQSEASTLHAGVPLAWSLVGFVGQCAWSGRFVVQWLASERRGFSVLPVSFFTLGLFGSLLLTAYALRRQDWVNVAAYVLNPIPYGRNWLLLVRSRSPARVVRAEASEPHP